MTPRPTEDETNDRALRDALVDKLARDGHVRTPRVEAAFRSVPRHLFVPGVPPERVYVDESIPTKKNAEGGAISSSSQPAIMAIMLEQLELQPGQRVLEVGAGTGYNAALLASLAGEHDRVTTVDLDEDIVEGARRNLAAAGFERVRVVQGDGALGYPPGAPYDRIVLTVGAWDLLPAWREQLAAGGRLLLPLAVRVAQWSIAFEDRGDHLESVSIRGCGFMALRGPSAGPRRFAAIGADPGLTLTVDDASRIDPEGVYRLLLGPSLDQPTGLVVSPNEIAEGLISYLAVREPRYARLLIDGPAAERGLAPVLFGRYGGGPAHTEGLFDTDALALLIRPGASTPPPESNPLEATPFDLQVRAYGGPALARHLTELLRTWDAAGRPDDRGLRLRAYPHEVSYRPLADELVVEKPRTRLVVDWPDQAPR